MDREWVRHLDRWAASAHDVVVKGLEPMVPVECVVCRAESVALCVSCRRMLHRTGGHPVRVETHARHADGLPIVAAGPYEHELATCILAMKQSGRTDLLPYLAPLLGGALQRAVASSLPGLSRNNQETPLHRAGQYTGDQGDELPVAAGLAAPVELVPIPTSARALRRRWYDPVEELLKACRRADCLPAQLRVVPWLVHRSRDPGASWRELDSLVPLIASREKAQKSLSARQRKGAATARYRVAAGRRERDGHRRGPGCVILVDDVVTTGATLAQARNVLVGGGATVLGAVVLAATRTPSENTESGPVMEPGPR